MDQRKEDTSEQMLNGALPLVWLIMIGLSTAKLLPVGLDSSITDLLPGWFGIITTSVVLAVITFFGYPE